MDANIDFDRIRSETFVRTIETHEAIESTNNRALSLTGSSTAELPWLVIARQQTGGRGRGSNQWWSPTGGLTFSLIVDVESTGLPIEKWPTVSLTAGLSVCEALVDVVSLHAGTLQSRIALKWPNDVMFAGKKICGILTELPPQRTGEVVLGIGINVNNSLASAPEELRSTATSLIDELHVSFSLTDVLVGGLRRLEDNLQRLHDGERELLNRWRQYCYLNGKAVTLDTGQRQIAGACQGIDEDGALLLRTEFGIERVLSGVVTKIE